MPRTARLVVPGLPHHVTQRGNRRQRTFFSDHDYVAYRDLLAGACRTSGVQVLAWCLMPNHVHLILTPPQNDALRAALADTHRRYTVRINRREGWTGYLWQGRFASTPMDHPHLMSAARYVELNPVRAGLVATPDAWPWSSARAHLSGRPDGLTDLEPLLAQVADWSDFLGLGLSEPDLQAIRAAEKTGHPLCARDFLLKIGQQQAEQTGTH